MTTDIDHHTLALTIVRLQTSIQYHIFFLAVIFFIGISLSIYIIDSLQDLEEDLSGVGALIVVMQKDIDYLNQQMDRYHSNARP